MNRLERFPLVAAFLVVSVGCFGYTCPNGAKAQAPAAPPAPSATLAQAAQSTPTPSWASIIPVYVLAPLRIVENIGGPAVQVRLEDKADATFLLDTGANSCLISAAMARTLGLTPQPYEGTAKPAPLIPYKSVTLERVQFANLNTHGFFLVAGNALGQMDFGQVDGKPIDGVLGTNVLSHFAVVFDFEQNQVILIPGGKLSDTQRAALGFGKIRRVPGTTVEKENSNRFDVPLSVTLSPEQTLSEQVLVDTGRYQTILGGPAKMRGKSLYDQTVRGVDGEVGFSIYKAHSAQVGEAKLEPFFGGITSNPETPVTLGMDFMSRFRVLMDFPAGEMCLAPVANRAPFPTLAARVNGTRQIGQVVYEPTEQGQWYVKRVDVLAKGGEAEMKAGDLVREINGRKTDGMLTGEFIFLFKKDNVFKIVLLRDGKNVAVAFRYD